jgi:glucose-1-phosphate thymidylyltransferase
MNAIVLAAGFGTRLGDVGKKQPKAFLPMGRGPAIDRVVGALNVPEIHAVHIVHNGLWSRTFRNWIDTVADHSDGPHAGRMPYVKLHSNAVFSVDQRLGAVGDLEFVLKRLGDPREFVLYCGDNVPTHTVEEFLGRAEDRAEAWLEVRTSTPHDQDLGRLQVNQEGEIVGLSRGGDSRSGVWLGPAYFPAECVPMVGEYCAQVRSEGKLPDELGGFVDWLARRFNVRGAAADPGELCFEIGSPHGLELARTYFGGGR